MQPFGQKAKENLQKGGKISQQGSQISAKAVDTRKELAKQASVSHDTISKVEAQGLITEYSELSLLAKRM